MKDILEKAAQYERTYAIVGRGHYLAADRLAHRNRWFGIPVVIITAVVGTTIFGTLDDNNLDPKWKIAAGIISLTGAVLAALQTSLKFAETSERHKAVGARYRAIRRRLDLFALRYAAAPADQRLKAIGDLDALNEELAALATESPNLPDDCYDKATLEYEAENKQP